MGAAISGSRSASHGADTVTNFQLAFVYDWADSGPVLGFASEDLSYPLGIIIFVELHSCRPLARNCIPSCTR